MAILFETTLGDFVVDLYTELAPRTSVNFLKLCKIKYYHNALFFSVQKNFVATCGHLTKDSSLGKVLDSTASGYIPDEFHSMLRHNRIGTVSMANRGPDMTASRVLVT